MSIRFIHKSHAEEEKATKRALKKGREKAKIEYKDLERNEIEKRKLEKARKNKTFKKTKTELKKEGKQTYKKKSTSEQDDIKKQIKEKVYIEYPYLDELPEAELEIIKLLNESGKIIYIDPGKKDILYIMNKHRVYFRYTIQERIKETGRKKYQCKTEKYKRRNGIHEIEKQITNLNSKEVELNKFKNYVKKKNEINDELIEKYKDDIFRKSRWYMYINTQRSEQKLINKICKVYGEDIRVIYGDWSTGKQSRNFISTPNKGIKRLHGRAV